jgi:hypothetical protein
VSEWIACSERLPPTGQIVLAWNSRHQGVWVYQYAMKSGKAQWFNLTGDRSGFRVSHWMPLPDPPQTSSKEPGSQ